MTFNLIKNLQYYNIQLISGLNLRMASCTMYFKQGICYDNNIAFARYKCSVDFF